MGNIFLTLKYKYGKKQKYRYATNKKNKTSTFQTFSRKRGMKQVKQFTYLESTKKGDGRLKKK